MRDNLFILYVSVPWQRSYSCHDISLKTI